MSQILSSFGMTELFTKPRDPPTDLLLSGEAVAADDASHVLALLDARELVEHPVEGRHVLV